MLGWFSVSLAGFRFVGAGLFMLSAAGLASVSFLCKSSVAMHTLG